MVTHSKPRVGGLIPIYNKGNSKKLTISRSGDLGSWCTERGQVFGVIAVHAAWSVEVELLEPGITGVGSVDGSSSFPDQAGRARTRGRVRSNDGASNALWSVIIVQVHGGRGNRGHGLGRSNQGDDLCHFERKACKQESQEAFGQDRTGVGETTYSTSFGDSVTCVVCCGFCG